MYYKSKIGKKQGPKDLDATRSLDLYGDGKINSLYSDEMQGGIVNHSDQELLSYIRSMKPTRVIINQPYENNNQIKFTIQAMKYLEPSGKLVSIMPSPTLTHNQGKLTDKLFAMANLEYVIKLPTFYF